MIPPTVEQRYCSVEAASHYCAVSRTTIYKLIRDGEIRSSLVGVRRVVDLRSIDEYLDRNRDRLADPDPPGGPDPVAG